MVQMTPFLFVVFIILFIIWQFYVLAKYNFGYSAVRLDVRSSKLIIDNKPIRFDDIKTIRIVPDEKQPTSIERGLSKGASYIYLTTIEIYLNNGAMMPVKCNTKAIIENLINNAEYLPELIYNEIECEEQGIPPLIVGLLFVVILYIAVFIITSFPH